MDVRRGCELAQNIRSDGSPLRTSGCSPPDRQRNAQQEQSHPSEEPNEESNWPRTHERTGAAEEVWKAHQPEVPGKLPTS